MNQKGYALAITTALLPVLLGFFFLLWTAIGLIQFNQNAQYACRSALLTGQEKAAGELARLMELNPKARKLQHDMIAARLQLEAAVASMNAVAEGVALARIAKIEAQQGLLHARQKQLIMQADFQLGSAFQKAQKELQKSFSRGLSQMPFLNVQSRWTHGISTRLSVDPESPDMAPTYRLQEPFEEKQTLAQFWQSELAVRGPFQRFLDGSFKWKGQCRVTLKKDRNQWIVKIKKDKSSSKLF